MGKPIVYCGDCGRSLREEDFDRRRAGHAQNRPYCSDCRPDVVAPTPRQSISSTRIRALPVSTPSRALRPAPSKAAPVIFAAAVGGALLVVAVAAVLSSKPKPAAPSPPAVTRAVAPTSPAPPPPTPSPPRPAAEPKPLPPAPEPPPPAPEDPAVVLERFLADIQKVRADDPGFKRAGEVRAMLHSAAQMAGPRKGEIDALLAAYEKDAAAGVAPAPTLAPPPAAKPAAPLGEIVGFTLIDADTEKPVPGYESLASGSELDLGKLGLKRIDVRINTSPKEIGSIETLINQGKPHIESGFPYSFTINSVADGFTGWIPAPGTHTLKCRLWSEDKRKGQPGPWVTLTLTVVDPR